MDIGFKFNLPFKFDLPKLGGRKVVIDWGSSALKIVSASKQKDSYLITDFAYKETGGNLSLDLSRVWEKKNFPLVNITVALDGASTLVRVIDFPLMDKKLIRESLGYELSKYVPFSSEEVYFDYHILDKESGEETLKLIIAVVKKDFLDEKMGLLKSAGIMSSKVTLGPVSLSNVFLKSFPQQEKPVAILDIGFSYSMVIIIYKNSLYLSRELKRGAKDIFTRISNILGKKINNFEDLENSKDSLEDNFLADASSDLVEEIKISLDYLETKENLLVDKVYVTGGLISSERVKNVLPKALGIELLPFNIFKYFSCAPGVQEKLAPLEGNFAVALSSLL